MTHLMSVSALVLEHGGTEDQAIAGLLHDAVEDAPAGQGGAVLAEIRERFGDAVADMVAACSDGLNDSGRAEGHVAGAQAGVRRRAAAQVARRAAGDGGGQDAQRALHRRRRPPLRARTSGRRSTRAATSCSGTTRASNEWSPSGCRAARSPTRLDRAVNELVEAARADEGSN